jgi:Carboxypeptidase regulatory-like domain
MRVNSLRLLLLCLPALLLGQNSGVISGTVTDPTQAVIPNASVTIVNAETGVTAWRGVTNDSGLYRAPDLRAGRYNVTVKLRGFKQAVVNGINAIRTPGEFDVDLAVGREFPIRERLKLKIRAEAFNVLNHTNLRGPNVSLTATTNAAGQPIFNSPGFGIITAARAARFMQLVARIEF